MAKHISQLDPLLSSRIAAGEVIERPQSILRELLDNALDAGADEIKVIVEGGGIDRLEVQDNGSGIHKEDLSLIGTRHATSKIHDPDDLYTINTLGFRGEALYSISAVSKLTISSKDSENNETATLVIDNGRRYPVTSDGPDKGTIVSSENLFADIPARRSFLKRSSTEAQLCRNLLIAKALAFPQVRFTLKTDGATKLDWQKTDSLKERVMMLYREDSIVSGDVNYLEEKAEDYTVRIVAGNSSVKRSDKREIRIYVNGRPVEEFSMVQAVIYGYGELLPGGSYPYACVFIEDKPELVDFNIHPAKKEVKIRNKADIHHTISTMLKTGIERKIPEITANRQFYLDDAERWENGKKTTSFGVRPEAEKATFLGEKNFSFPQSPIATSSVPKKEASYTKSQEQTFTEKSSTTDTMAERYRTYKEKDSNWLEKAKALQDTRNKLREQSAPKTEELRKVEEKRPDDEIVYIGQAFKLFLICQKGEELYLVDQHAAHERILYDEIISQKTVQQLLVPIKMEVDDITDDFLDKTCFVYTKLGIHLVQSEKGKWEITAIPALCKGIETQIVDFVTSCKADEHELEEKLFAIIACKAAIKQGDEIDRWSAEAILEKVFQMDEPCCPHGRTFLVKLSAKELREMVGRTK